MTINFYNPSVGDGLFDIQARFFAALDALNAARGASVLTPILESIEQFKAVYRPSLSVEAALQGIPGAMTSFQASGSTLSGPVVRTLTQHLIEVVNEDVRLPTKDLQTALVELIRQMEAEGYYVDANAVTLAVAADSGNQGDLSIAYTERRGDGRVQQHTLAEAIKIEVTGDLVATTPGLKFEAERQATSKLREDWPAGSSGALQLSGISPGGADDLITNGDFEDETVADHPDNWIANVGTIGTTIQLTHYEVQTVTIAGTPTGGTYILKWTNAAGITRSTAPLTYSAAASVVQAALRTIPGLEDVTVASSGTSPNYVHTVSFIGVAGQIAALAYVSHLTGGSPSITIDTIEDGDPDAFVGKSLKLIGDGAELTDLHQALTVTPETVYLCHFWLKRHEVAAGGVLRVAIVDGIGGNVTTDKQGNANSTSINATAVSTGDFAPYFFSFRTARTTTNPVYLQIKLTTALTGGAALIIDNVCVIAARQLYAGGPFVGVFTGKNAAVNGDKWTLTATNSRAGTIQEWYERVFDMRGKELLLPTAGTTLIPDTVITDEESSSSSSSTSSAESSSSSGSSSASSSSSSDSTSSGGESSSSSTSTNSSSSSTSSVDVSSSSSSSVNSSSSSSNSSSRSSSSNSSSSSSVA